MTPIHGACIVVALMVPVICGFSSSGEIEAAARKLREAMTAQFELETVFRRKAPPMRLIPLAFLVLAIYAASQLTSCAHVPPTAVACVADTSLIPQVIDDLRSDDYAARLEAMAARIGLCIVNATVESLLGPRAAADPIVASHARAWLESHPVQ